MKRRDKWRAVHICHWICFGRHRIGMCESFFFGICLGDLKRYWLSQIRHPWGIDTHMMFFFIARNFCAPMLIYIRPKWITWWPTLMWEISQAAFHQWHQICTDHFQHEAFNMFHINKRAPTAIIIHESRMSTGCSFFSLSFLVALGASTQNSIDGEIYRRPKWATKTQYICCFLSHSGSS